ncbi:MAG: hypothetical protein ACYTEZ_19610 [Planctomycetota bacterium]|jgi:hypothetical protein
MRRILVPAFLVAILGLTSTLDAEKPDMSPASLRKIATHVVTGTVNAVYSRARMQGKMKVTRYVAEVRVKALEKGKGIEKDQLVYVRYWEQAWTGSFEDMPTGTGGHRYLPDEGATLRIYLARNAYDGFGDDNKDGGLNVIGANGFERLEKGGSK